MGDYDVEDGFAAKNEDCLPLVIRWRALAPRGADAARFLFQEDARIIARIPARIAWGSFFHILKISRTLSLSASEVCASRSVNAARQAFCLLDFSLPSSPAKIANPLLAPLDVPNSALGVSNMA